MSRPACGDAHPFRVTATPGATCTRADASTSPHAAGGAPGMGEVAAALDPTSETEVARTARTGGRASRACSAAPGVSDYASVSDPTSEAEQGAPTDSLAAVHEPPDGRSRPVADSGGQGPASVSDATSPGEVAASAVAAPPHELGIAEVPAGVQHTSPGGSTSRWSLVIRRRTGCQPRTDVEVKEGIL